MDKKTDWMQTYTGIRFYPMEPSSDDVYIEDIAHALSLMCRFGGHCREFYSVAQHSVLVSIHCEHKLHGLLHDAEEAYLTDMIRPVKRSLKALGVDVFEKAAFTLSQVIAYRFGLALTREAEEDVKKWDNIMLSTEARDIMTPMADGSQWTSADLFDKLNYKIVPVCPADAERMFLNQYRRLTDARI